MQLVNKEERVRKAKMAQLDSRVQEASWVILALKVSVVKLAQEAQKVLKERMV